MDFGQFVTENFSTTNKFGCAMAYYQSPKFFELQAKIDTADVYNDPTDSSYGLEKEPHVTLLYGLHSDEIKDADVFDICMKQHIFLLALMNVSIFPSNGKYEVLKFDVGNPYLANINAELRKLPNTNSFPEYHPHSTIAYLLPGKSQKYIDMFKGIQINVKVTSIVYSKPNGQKFSKPWY